MTKLNSWFGEILSEETGRLYKLSSEKRAKGTLWNYIIKCSFNLLSSCKILTLFDVLMIIIIIIIMITMIEWFTWKVKKIITTV